MIKFNRFKLIYYLNLCVIIILLLMINLLIKRLFKLLNLNNKYIYKITFFLIYLFIF